METPIGPYLDDYTLLEQPGVSAQLHDVVRAYPWFTLGRYMQLRSLRGIDPAGYHRALRQADVRLFAHPYPRLLLDEIPGATLALSSYYTASYAESSVTPDTASLIDGFLDTFGEGGRITPPTMTPVDPYYVQEDISAPSVTDDGELATETLAEIYLAQGLPDRAIEIYYKLSLKYPEKSAYFADLIADVNTRHDGRTGFATHSY